MPMSNKLNDMDAQILALERELAGTGDKSSDDGEDDKIAKLGRREAKKARKAKKMEMAAKCSTDTAPEAPSPNPKSLLFSVHAGETVHFSGRKPGEPKPKRGGKKRAREAEVTSVPAWRCELCNICVNSEELLKEHYDGRRHFEMKESREARAAGLYCETCALTFTSQEQLEDHLKGGRHRALATGDGWGGKGKGNKGGGGKGGGGKGGGGKGGGGKGGIGKGQGYLSRGGKGTKGAGGKGESMDRKQWAR